MRRSTGIKDKNGKEIMEGHLVKVVRDCEFRDEYTGIVTYDTTELVGFRVVYTKNNLTYVPYLCGWYEYEILEDQQCSGNIE